MAESIIGEIKVLIKLYEGTNDTAAFIKKLNELTKDGFVSDQSKAIMIQIIGANHIDKEAKRRAKTELENDRPYDPCTNPGGNVR